jgi:hypothetical protein
MTLTEFEEKMLDLQTERLAVEKDMSHALNAIYCQLEAQEQFLRHLVELR